MVVKWWFSVVKGQVVVARPRPDSYLERPRSARSSEDRASVSAIAAPGNGPLRRGLATARQERDTRTERPQRAHVQRSYSLPGQPADSLWKMSTSGTAKIVSIAQRRPDFRRTSIR